LCGEIHAACGPRGTGDPITITPGRRTVGELKPYAATIHGHETTLMLTDDEAKARGLADVADKQARPASNKSRTASNK
jgi:hypothetical protein